MVFPATALDIEVSLALGADLSDPGSWSWTDITSYVREANGIRIRRGRTNERSIIPPSRCTMTVDNSDGRFCRFNPLGTWYGQIGKNTPIRVRVNPGSGYVTRFTGFVAGWPPSWDPSESDQTVTLVADGILRRLEKGRVLRSALYRTMAGVSPDDYVPLAYWPLEDGSTATTFASGLVDGQPVTAPSNVEMGSYSDLVSSGPLPVFSAGAAVTFLMPSHTATDRWWHQFVISVPEEPASETTFYEVKASGTTATYRLTFAPGTPATANLYEINAAGSTVATHTLLLDGSVGAPAEADVWGRPVMVTLGSQSDFPSGGQVTTWFHLSTTSDISGGVAGSSTAGTATSIRAVRPFGGNGAAFGHLGVWVDTAFTFADVAQNLSAFEGWIVEEALDRAARLGVEERVDITVVGSSSQAMGAQRPNSLVGLWRECATTDFALFYEALDGGLVFKSSTVRTNQSAAITVDYSAGQVAPPWDPADDDRDFFNDVTASRPDGSQARVADEASIAAVGVYDTTVSANTATDAQLQHVAGWAENLGTVDELRWPAMRLNFAASPELIDDWFAADIGDQLHVIEHPSPLAPDTIRQIIEGYDELIKPFQLEATINLSPASGWDVAELDDDDLGKVDTDGCELVAAVNSSATTLIAATTSEPNSPLWTTDGGEMPIPMILGGEVVSTTAVANQVTDTFARSTSSGWGTAGSSGLSWSTSGGSASDYSTDGTSGLYSMGSVNVARQTFLDTSSTAHDVLTQVTIPVTPTGASIVVAVIFGRVDSSNYYLAQLVVTTAGVRTIQIRKVSGGSFSDVTTAATISGTHSGSVTYRIQAQIRGGQQHASAWVSASGSPGYWMCSGTDTSVVGGTIVGCRAMLNTGNTNVTPSIAWDNYEVQNPQRLTVTRAVNSVSKSQTAGTAINVYGPARASF